MSNNQSIIKIKNFSFAYAIEPQKTVLKSINLEIEPGSFNVFCGMSGSGKTTLLRHLKDELAPKGEVKGKISFLHKNDKLNQKPQIAFVMQNPETQIIMDTVWHELAFGLENQGLSASEIERRIAEITNFFGIEKWLDQPIENLSGGEKQILNLASNLILQPEILILDEPTTQLDPIAKRDFLQMLFYTHAETGITILMSEHNLNDLLENTDKIIFLDQGEIKFQGEPRGLAKFLIEADFAYQKALPFPTRMYKFVPQTEPALSIVEGRKILKQEVASGRVDRHSNKQSEGDNSKNDLKPVLFADKLWFRYQKDSELILKEANIKIYKNQILAIVGGNGSGKSTFLYLLSQALQPLRGKINIKDKPRIAMLGQNPETIFSQDTVEAVLREYQKRFGNTENEIKRMIEIFDLNHLLARHPFDLSGGEKQKLALAKILLTKPDILLLDEPTNSLDILNKEKIKEILLKLKETTTIVLVTHDLDFVADVADTVAMLFNKKVVAKATTREFFKENSYFTTTTYRLTREILPDCIKFADLEKNLLQFQKETRE